MAKKSAEKTAAGIRVEASHAALAALATVDPARRAELEAKAAELYRKADAISPRPVYGAAE